MLKEVTVVCNFLVFPGRIPGEGVDLMGQERALWVRNSFCSPRPEAIPNPRVSGAHRKWLTGSWVHGRSGSAAPGLRRASGGPQAPGSNHPLLFSFLFVARARPRAPSALCLVLGCMIFPDGWDAETIRDMCGAKTGKYSLGDCSVRWAYILAIIGILNALILSFLAFVLGNRQTDLLQEELKQENKGECALPLPLSRVGGCGGGGSGGGEEFKVIKAKPESETVQTVRPP